MYTAPLSAGEDGGISRSGGEAAVLGNAHGLQPQVKFPDGPQAQKFPDGARIVIGIGLVVEHDVVTGGDAENVVDPGTG